MFADCLSNLGEQFENAAIGFAISKGFNDTRRLLEIVGGFFHSTIMPHGHPIGNAV